jgi:uncharacterized RDD family membrane protein YckC
VDDLGGRNAMQDAPPGARCAVHVEAPATVVCARCGNYCCYECGVSYNASYLCTACHQIERKDPHYGDATKGQRFANFFIDQIAARIAAYGGALLFSTVGAPSWASFIVVVAAFVGYYVVFEHTIGATIGKLVTRTKVVARDGGKPTLGQIVGRTFARYIPLEPFSCLSDDGGWHDTLSKTRVVRLTPPSWLA